MKPPLRRPELRRASDRIATTAIVISIICVFITAVTSVIALTNTVRIGDFREIQMRTEQEGIERRDQSCTLFERQHLAEVNQLRDTYTYLVNLPRNRWDDPLNKFILSALPEVEQTASIDSAPEYCDEPNVGLPEPDPKIPARPAELENVGRLP
jgi:hypothetical protein